MRGRWGGATNASTNQQPHARTLNKALNTKALRITFSLCIKTYTQLFISTLLENDGIACNAIKIGEDEIVKFVLGHNLVCCGIVA